MIPQGRHRPGNASAVRQAINHQPLEGKMKNMRLWGGIVLLVMLLMPGRVATGQSQLEAALADLYAICLFEGVDGNPFAQSAAFARNVFAPGINGFLESSLSAIPLTPPNLDLEYVDGELVNVATGFTPIYTESSSTIGKGLFMVGANASYFNLSQIRGESLDALSFSFAQDGGGDRINVTMPFSMEAYAFSIFGAYGVTDRLDLGVMLPFMRLTIDNVNTTFSVEGNASGCRYRAPQDGGLNCSGRGAREVDIALANFVDLSASETFLEAVALRAKYRFPVGSTAGRLAALVDVRIPTRGSSSLLGDGNFSTKLLLVGEYDGMASFKPYVNAGAQFWNGNTTNRLNLGGGFNQQLASRVFFAFDLLGQVQLERDPFLTSLTEGVAAATEEERPLAGSTISLSSYDHTLNAGLGLKVAVTPGVQVYGSALFSLLDQGLQSSVVPSIGGAFHF